MIKNKGFGEIFWISNGMIPEKARAIIFRTWIRKIYLLPAVTILTDPTMTGPRFGSMLDPVSLST